MYQATGVKAAPSETAAADDTKTHKNRTSSVAETPR